jgi:hypothetical protein
MRILLLDIETAPNVAYTWGLWQQDINLTMLEAPGYVMCWAAQWAGETKVMFDSVARSGKKKMLKGIHELMCEADAIITYNGIRFDIPHLNGQFILNGMTPPSPASQIDLMRTVKSRFKFPSNKLEYVCGQLGIGKKVKHQGFDLWLGCLRNDAKAWRTMERYNKMDVTLLVGLYNHLLPWIKNHPNRNLYLDDTTGKPQCSHCLGNLQRRGFSFTASGKYARFQCMQCGAWHRGKKNIANKTETRRDS